MLLTAVSQVVFYVLYALVINTKSTSISGPENARQRLVMTDEHKHCAMQPFDAASGDHRGCENFEWEPLSAHAAGMRKGREHFFNRILW